MHTFNKKLENFRLLNIIIFSISSRMTRNLFIFNKPNLTMLWFIEDWRFFRPQEEEVLLN